MAMAIGFCTIASAFRWIKNALSLERYLLLEMDNSSKICPWFPSRCMLNHSTAACAFLSEAAWYMALAHCDLVKKIPFCAMNNALPVPPTNWDVPETGFNARVLKEKNWIAVFMVLVKE